MTACATLAALTPTAVQMPLAPIVLLDGAPEPRLTVSTFTCAAPLDRRAAVLRCPATLGRERPEIVRRWLRASAVLALPLRLSDEQVAWTVLAAGRLQRRVEATAIGTERHTLDLVDTWSAHLDQPVALVWWQQGGAAASDRVPAALVSARPTGAALRLGAAGNRSTRTWPIGAGLVHVLQERGEGWTVATALATLSALADLDLDAALLPTEIQRGPLLAELDLGRPVGELLEQVLAPYGLVVQRDLAREGGAVVEHRPVRPAGVLPAVDLTTPAVVLRAESAAAAPAAQPWIARAGGWVVESTFTLVPGWDPAREGQSAGTYERTAGTFADYANVYRLWVLNEDGYFTAPPFARGPAYRLAALFGDSTLRPQAVPLGPCLTLDDAGNRRPARVEMSLDQGQSWQAYPGAASVRPERAGAYLEDAALPAEFFAAALAGQARVRVTATLRSPQPVEARRWRGNPFAGALPARVFELGEAFVFRRVDAGSIHAAGIAAGTLDALQVDQTAALRNWLTQRLRRPDAARAAPPVSDRATLTLAGVWPVLRVGGRVEWREGSAVVRSVTCRWEEAETVVEC